MFEIYVPATTANLGPGFDALGMALDWQARFVFEKTKNEDRGHLSVISYRRALSALGAKGPPLKVTTPQKIPVGKGMGSSAACIVAGVMAAYHMSGKDVHPTQLLEIATQIEGHPDNVTPAYLGGLTVSGWEGGRLSYGRLPLSDALSFALLIPSFSLPTSKARNVLPKNVTFEDAAFNLSRLGLVISALGSGDEELVQSAFRDRMHQPYRLKLIEESQTLIEMAKACGALAVVLSGAGPSFLIIRKKTEQLRGLSERLKQMKHSWKLHLVDVDHQGAKLKR